MGVKSCSQKLRLPTHSLSRDYCLVQWPMWALSFLGKMNKLSWLFLQGLTSSWASVLQPCMGSASASVLHPKANFLGVFWHFRSCCITWKSGLLLNFMGTMLATCSRLVLAGDAWEQGQHRSPGGSRWAFHSVCCMSFLSETSKTACWQENLQIMWHLRIATILTVRLTVKESQVWPLWSPNFSCRVTLKTSGFASRIYLALSKPHKRHFISFYHWKMKYVRLWPKCEPFCPDLAVLHHSLWAYSIHGLPNGAWWPSP